MTRLTRLELTRIPVCNAMLRLVLDSSPHLAYLVLMGITNQDINSTLDLSEFLNGTLQHTSLRALSIFMFTELEVRCSKPLSAPSNLTDIRIIINGFKYAVPINNIMPGSVLSFSFL